jgi:hypothetical protein
MEGIPVSWPKTFEPELSLQFRNISDITVVAGVQDTRTVSKFAKVQLFTPTMGNVQSKAWALTLNPIITTRQKERGVFELIAMLKDN